MSRKKRQKASDVFRETNYLLGKTASFNEAFPTIEDLQVVVKESGKGARGLHGESERRHWFDGKHPPGEYVDCSNPLCYDGGVRVGRYLRIMVRKEETEGEFSDLCQGYEGSPKGQRRYGPCSNLFQTEIELTYKREQGDENGSGR